MRAVEAIRIRVLSHTISWVHNHDRGFTHVAPDVDRCEVTRWACIIESERNDDAGGAEGRLQVIFVRQVLVVPASKASVLVFDLNKDDRSTVCELVLRNDLANAAATRCQTGENTSVARRTNLM
jgi:hypothetical protein